MAISFSIMSFANKEKPNHIMQVSPCEDNVVDSIGMLEELFGCMSRKVYNDHYDYMMTWC